MPQGCNLATLKHTLEYTPRQSTELAVSVGDGDAAILMYKHDGAERYMRLSHLAFAPDLSLKTLDTVSVTF